MADTSSASSTRMRSSAGEASSHSRPSTSQTTSVWIDAVGWTARISASSPASTSAIRAFTKSESARWTGRISQSKVQRLATTQRPWPPSMVPTLKVVEGGLYGLGSGARVASSSARPIRPLIQRLAWCTALTARAGSELCPSRPVMVVRYS